MKWPIKAVNISGREIKQSFAAKNPPLTTEEPTSHQELPALYSTAISSVREPFLGQISNAILSIPPKSWAALCHLILQNSCTFSGNLPALPEPGSDLPPLSVWIDTVKEFILNIHRGSFFPSPCWGWWIPSGFGCSYTTKALPGLQIFPGAAREAGKLQSHTELSRRNGTYVPNNTKASGSGSKQENSHRFPGTTNRIFTPCQELQIRDPLGGITSDLPSPRFPSVYFSWSVRQTRQRTFLSCFKSLSKDMKSGQKSWWVLGVQDTRGCHSNCRRSFLMSGALKDGATTSWSELHQVPRAIWNSEIEFPANLDPAAFPVKLRVHRIVLKEKVAGKSTDTDYFFPP